MTQTEHDFKIALAIPLECIDMVQYKWHRRGWDVRALYLMLGVVAAKEAGLDCADFHVRWNEIWNQRQERNSKVINDRARELERDIRAKIGQHVRLLIRRPPIETTAECGRFLASMSLQDDSGSVRFMVEVLR